MDCYFRQRWKDKRLAFENLPGAENLTELPVAIRMLDRIWKPDTYFYNGKQSHIHTVTIPNKFFRIQRDGSLLYSMRYSSDCTIERFHSVCFVKFVYLCSIMCVCVPVFVCLPHNVS